MPTSNYLDTIQLDSAKLRRIDMHRHADLVELNCLQSPDREIPLEDSLDEQLGGDEGVGGIYQHDSQSDLTELNQAEKKDHITLLHTDVQNHLNARVQLFGDSYPFEIERGYIRLKAAHDMKRKTYVFLLLAANVCYLSREDIQQFTKDFEITAAFALREFFPHWTCRIFGTASCENLEGYEGTPRKKIETFAQDVGLPLLIEEEELRRIESSSGDAGLDVVAWYPFNDEAPHTPVFLAQVGCTKDEKAMFSKQYSAYPSRWERKLRGLSAIGCMVTPQCYRNARNEWPSPSDVNSVFVDRARVLRLLAQSADFRLESLKTYSMIESIFAGA